MNEGLDVQRDAASQIEPPASPPGAHTALHALIAVARHHGIHLSAEQVRRDHALGPEEPADGLLVRIAGDNGLTARPARLTWRHLTRAGRAMPILLRLKGGPAMVLVGMRSDPGRVPVALLLDPASPDRTPVAVDEIRLAAVWDGAALLVKRRYAATDDQKPFGFAWLAGQLLRERRIFRDIAVSGLVLSFFALVPPLVYFLIIDRILTFRNTSTLALLVGLVAFVLVFDMVFGALRRYLVAVGTAKIDARIGLYIFDRLIGLPIEFFERNATGLVAHKLNEVWRVRNFLTGQLFTVALDCTVLLFILPVMFLISVPLSLVVLGVAALMWLVVMLYIGPLSRAYGWVIEAEQRKGSFLIEVIHGMRTVKSLALEGRKRLEWDARVAQAVQAGTRFQLLNNQPQTILQPLEKGVYLSVLLIGCWFIINDGHEMYGGSLIAFSMLANRATHPFAQIAGLLQQFQEVRGALAQVSSVVNLEPERTRRDSGVRPRIRGEISFSDVRFRYPGATAPALDEVGFTVPAGSLVGIMGRSGSGKTTVTRLLQGLHEGFEGLIKIDGVDLREFDLSHLRANLGVVLQDNFLFRGTIRENIAAARVSATHEEVIEAARLAGAEEFIERLPRGYDTMVEEGSANLSGGQRQRIAIARALLIDPPILILDEATSALDPDSEAIINANLTRIAGGRTMIVISHRLNALVNCDQILVLERGRLHDAGRHEALLGRCEIYRHLWHQQHRHLTPGSPHDRAARTSIAPV